MYEVAGPLDTDLYQLTMANLAWLHFPKLRVRYQFKNRSLSVNLAEILNIRRLQESFEDVRQMRFADSEITYLQNLGLFDPGFLSFLRSVHLPEVEIENRAGWLSVEYEGDWPAAVLWETMALAIINQQYFEAIIDKDDRDELEREGVSRLRRKIEVLKEHPNIRFLEFGSRRRYTMDWQDYVVAELKHSVPDQLLGTSNVRLAQSYDLKASGTMAHQLFMVLSAYHLAQGTDLEPLVAAQQQVLRLWYEQYSNHPEMLMMLPDTFGTEFFLRNCSHGTAHDWTGIRQDSGDPFAIGERILRFYRQNFIDPREKRLVFSDGLDINKMLALAHHFDGRVDYSYGWGTSLTADLGPSNLSIVIKPSAVNGHPTVKLSDDFSKATGSPDDIDRYKALTKYGTGPENAL